MLPKLSWSSISLLLSTMLLAGVLVSGPAQAVRYIDPDDEIDPKTFEIDQPVFLGSQVDKDYVLVDEAGKPFRLGDLFGKPLVLILSYYTCDGSCSSVNQDFLSLLPDIERMDLGKDYRVLTLSFDANDTPQTLKAFKDKLALPEQAKKDWRFATFDKKEDLKELAATVGFKFYWVRRDKTFYHPNVYMVLTPDGRVARYLSAFSIKGADLDWAVMEAYQGNVGLNQLVNYAVSLCYSYNYKDGAYTVNIPMFVGLGSLTLGVGLFGTFSLMFKRRKAKELGR